MVWRAAAITLLPSHFTGRFPFTLGEFYLQLSSHEVRPVQGMQSIFSVSVVFELYVGKSARPAGVVVSRDVHIFDWAIFTKQGSHFIRSSPIWDISHI